jgi:putative transposase
MIEKDNKNLSVSTQAEILRLNRSGIYYQPSMPSAFDLYINSRIDKLYTNHPEFGYRRITQWLKKYENLNVNHKKVLKSMVEMGIQAIYPRQNTSKPGQGNIIYPYLLKGLEITKPNQVWSIDITYVPIQKAWLYLVAIIDWYSRYVISWEIDDNLEIGFVLSACSKALKERKPEIMNSDQGSHFTSSKYTGLFLEAGSRVSMDHRGRAYDNIFIERLWRTLKYEDIYPRNYEYPKEARVGINRFLCYYNNERPHQALGYKTPEEVYFSTAGIS